MDKNYQDRTDHKPVTTEDKIWLPSSYTNNKPPPVSSVAKKRDINWGFAHKSFWEWVLLLGTLLAALGAIAIPFVVTIIGLNFTQQQAQLSIGASERQHQTDLQIARDQQQAAILQTYIDNIQDLLLNHNLLKSKPDDDVAILARARTLTALEGLDPERKRRLLLFLYEAKLIGFRDPTPNGKTYDPIINLYYANLRNADLFGADLHNANLVKADLSGANLQQTNLRNATLIQAKLIDANLFWADLGDANLDNADLTGADLRLAGLINANLSYTALIDAKLIDAKLSGADLSYAGPIDADLTGADLTGVNLVNANLIGANLKGAHNLTQQQLDQVSTCKAAILPKGLTCHHNQ